MAQYELVYGMTQAFYNYTAFSTRSSGVCSIHFIRSSLDSSHNIEVLLILLREARQVSVISIHIAELELDSAASLVDERRYTEHTLASVPSGVLNVKVNVFSETLYSKSKDPSLVLNPAATEVKFPG